MRESFECHVAIDEQLWIFNERQLQVILSIAQIEGNVAKLDIEIPLINDDGSLMCTHNLRRADVEVGEDGGLTLPFIDDKEEGSRDVDLTIVPTRNGHFSLRVEVPGGWDVQKESDLPEGGSE